PDVREGLKSKGIEIPGDTWFLAGMHDTTTDEVTLYDVDAVPESHAEDLAALRRRLAGAARAAREERIPRLPRAVRHDDVLMRARDWSETRPEWGLAGCAAFIAAPRHRTRGRDLGGRSFLHDYTWQTDDDFETLEFIMTAPVVVASWISLQYYASTVAPELFGAGDKTLHNVVGAIGVLEGTGGDLRTGLPLQSVHDGARWQHEPLRLHVAIEAPCAAINAVIERHEVVRQLVDHGWIHLFAIDEAGRLALRYAGQARWEATDPGAPPMAASPMAAEWHERRESPSSGGLRRRA
ncbi:MAG: putative inorganic carbon transporter subunit DabA, partial [Myxococcota bacterium]